MPDDLKIEKSDPEGMANVCAWEGWMIEAEWVMGHG